MDDGWYVSLEDDEDAGHVVAADAAHSVDCDESF